jgi:hypothetical protein
MRNACRIGIVFPLLIAALATAEAPQNMRLTPMPVPPRPVFAQVAGPPPTNLTLTPSSATILSISWLPAPGATRYLVSRSGAPDIAIEANAGFLENGRFRYGDVGRKPATLYTYSVVAQFPAPTLPSRSTAVQILMPTAFAPANFRASVSGPSAITLNWTSRPEATGYRIVRNGANSPAISFDVSGVSFVDQNAPAGQQYTYVICSLMRLATGEIYGGEFSAPISVLSRRFNMLALGDSVMWGQGLQDADKFSSKTAAWIKAQLGADVALDVKAHSGATTYPDPGMSPFETFSYDHEVPSDFPTIGRQIGLASTPGPASQFPASQVDLVLVDGCANNIGIFTILTPYPFDDDLSSAIQSYCNAGMTNILRDVVSAFPNADVIVTGYFRLISMKTDLRLLLPLFGFASSIVQPDSITAALASNSNLLQLRMAARSDLFYQQSNTALAQAVTLANGFPLPGRTRFNQIHFAPISPALENSYAAPSSWQWLMPSPPLYQDDVYDHRYAACDLAANAPHDPTMDTGASCHLASLGHPNVAGAQAYTSAITSVAASILPRWRAERSEPVTATMDNIVLNVQTIAGAADGATIVVTAVDGASGTTLAGRVLFNNVDAGALGAPSRYMFAAANPVDIVGSVQVPGRNPRYFTIPVRTFSASVTVANAAVTVVVTENVTGRGLNGTVTINANSPSAVTTPTGQPINFSLCATPGGFHADHPLPGQPQCGGIVHVPYYPDVRY